MLTSCSACSHATWCEVRSIGAFCFVVYFNDEQQHLHSSRHAFSLQRRTFPEWAMLGSNQRPLPCEGSTIVCWTFLELAKYLQTAYFCIDAFLSNSGDLLGLLHGCCTRLPIRGTLHAKSGSDTALNSSVRVCLPARTSSAVHSRRPRSTDLRLKSSIPAPRRRRSRRPPSPRPRQPSTRRPRRSRSRPAAGRRCCASASPPDRTPRRTPFTAPGRTRPARPRGRPTRRRCQWS